MILPAQQKLFSHNAHSPFGVYHDLINDVSTAHWDVQGNIFKNRRTSRKAWIFFGVYSPELICGIAIADAGFVANAFTYFYSFKDNVFVQDNALVPLGFASTFDPNLNSEWKLGKYSIRTENGNIHFDYNGKFKLNITAQNSSNGASVVAPSKGGRPFHFTYKNVCLPTELKIEHAGKTYAVNGNFGAIDFSKGYPPRETFWNWLAFIGKTETGKNVSVNLVKHFNDELENILWVDGKKTLLSSSIFSIQKPFNKNAWQISTTDKILDCTLTPNGARSENVNIIFMKSIFVQAYGKISGTLLINGVRENFTGTGVAEDHLALW